MSTTEDADRRERWAAVRFFILSLLRGQPEHTVDPQDEVAVDAIIDEIDALVDEKIEAAIARLHPTSPRYDA